MGDLGKAAQLAVARRGRSGARRGGWKQALKVTLVLLAFVASITYLFYPLARPTAPVLLAPETGATASFTEPVTAMQFRWRQGGDRLKSAEQPIPARLFILCVAAAEPGPECGGQGKATPILRSMLRATDLVRTPAAVDFAERLLNLVDPAYEYTRTLELPAAALPADLVWTVGACAESSLASCSFNRYGSPFTVEEINLEPVAIRGRSVAGEPPAIEISVTVANRGRSASGPFTLDLVAWPARASAGGGALTRLSDPGVSNNDLALLADGSVEPVLSVGKDQQLLAIIPPGATAVRWSTTVPGLAGEQSLSVAPCEPAPCHLSAQPAALVAAAPLYAVVVRLDGRDLVRETDETDNSMSSVRLRLPERVSDTGPEPAPEPGQPVEQPSGQ